MRDVLGADKWGGFLRESVIIIKLQYYCYFDNIYIFIKTNVITTVTL